MNMHERGNMVNLFGVAVQAYTNSSLVFTSRYILHLAFQTYLSFYAWRILSSNLHKTCLHHLENVYPKIPSSPRGLQGYSSVLAI